VNRQDDGRRELLYRSKLDVFLRGEPFPLRDGTDSGWSRRDTQHHVAVLEMSKESWLVAGIIPGVKRQPLKKLAADENELYGHHNRGYSGSCTRWVCARIIVYLILYVWRATLTGVMHPRNGPGCHGRGS
jgi:hypothetical protein